MKYKKQGRNKTKKERILYRVTVQEAWTRLSLCRETLCLAILRNTSMIVSVSDSDMTCTSPFPSVSLQQPSTRRPSVSLLWRTSHGTPTGVSVAFEAECMFIGKQRTKVGYVHRNDPYFVMFLCTSSLLCYEQQLRDETYPKVSGPAAWSENCKWYSSLPLGAVVSLFCESA
jgi:hypothetical protein